jgi:hypothetical protein
MDDPVEEAKKKKLPLKSAPPTPLTVKVVRERTGDALPGVTVTVDKMDGPARKGLTDGKGVAPFVLTPKDVATVTSAEVTARLLIQGGDKADGNKHGVTHQEVTATVPLTIGSPNSATLTLPNPCLAAFPNPGTDGTLARNLTVRQARDTLVHLHAQGEVTLVPEPVFKHDVSGCSVVTPVDSNTTRVRLRGAAVAKTVEYRVLITFDSAKKTVGTTGGGDLFLLQHRHAVGLFRLAKFLGRDSGWNAKKIFHIGISGADPFVLINEQGNRHTRGHCIDFGGAEIVIATGPDKGDTFTMTVLFDWGRAPVPDLDPANTDKLNPVVKTPVTFTPTNTTWPSGDTTTLPYRLEHVRGPNDRPRLFFLDVYQFLNREYCDATQVAGAIRLAQPDGKPGQLKGMVVHPDYPKEDPRGKTGRVAHDNHVHAEMPDDLPDPAPPKPPTP